MDVPHLNEAQACPLAGKEDMAGPENGTSLIFRLIGQAVISDGRLVRKPTQVTLNMATTIRFAFSERSGKAKSTVVGKNVTCRPENGASLIFRLIGQTVMRDGRLIREPSPVTLNVATEIRLAFRERSRKAKPTVVARISNDENNARQGSRADDRTR